MASQATAQPLADDNYDSSDNEGTPTAWGDDAANTDLDLVFDAPGCAKVVCKVHADRIREGAPGDIPPLGHVISKWLVEQLAAEPEAATITIEVTSGMQQVVHKLVDYLYGKPLEQSPESAVHLLVLCRQLVVRAGSKKLRQYLVRELADKGAARSDIVAIMMAALEHGVDTNDMAAMLYDGCLNHIASRLSEVTPNELVALPLASLLEIMAHDDVDSHATPDLRAGVVLGVMAKHRLPPAEGATSTFIAPPPASATTGHVATAAAGATAGAGAGAGAGAATGTGTTTKASDPASILFDPLGPLLTTAQFAQLVAHLDTVPPKHGLALLTWALAYKHVALIKASCDAVAKAFDRCTAAHLAGLPVNAVVEILSGDELAVEKEQVVFDTLLAYVGVRGEELSAIDLAQLWGCCRWRFLDMETLLVACEEGEETIPLRMLLQAMCAHELDASRLKPLLLLGAGSAASARHRAAARRLRPRVSYKNAAAVEEFLGGDCAIVRLQLCDASPLMEYLEPVTPSGQSWKLLYRASRDGWQTSDFHSRCDGQGPTVVLVHSKGSDCVFGAYAGKAWASSGGYQEYAAANSSFLFTLKDSVGCAPCKLAHKDGDSSATFCDGRNGPVFGHPNDINFHGSPMNDSVGYPFTKVNGVSYNLPSSAPNPYYMAGTTKKFVAAELEVFGLH